MQVRGGADFIERLTGDSGELWRKYGAENCFESLEQYSTFAKGITMITVARFKNFVKLENTKPAHLEKHSRFLQSFTDKCVNLATANQLIA